MGARSERAVRSGVMVRRFSVRSGVAVRRFAASDAAPWPDAVAAEPDGTRARWAAPWLEAAQGEPWREVAPAGPSPAEVQDGLWQGVPRVGPLQAARASCAPGHTSRCSPRSRRH